MRKNYALMKLFYIFLLLHSALVLSKPVVFTDSLRKKKQREAFINLHSEKYKTLTSSQLKKIDNVNDKFRSDAKDLHKKQKSFVETAIANTEKSRQKIMKSFESKILLIEKSKDSEAEKKLRLQSLEKIKINLTKGFDNKLEELKKPDFSRNYLTDEFSNLIQIRDSLIMNIINNKD